MTLSRVLMLVYVVLFFHSEKVVPFLARRWNIVHQKKFIESFPKKYPFSNLKATSDNADVQDAVWSRIRIDAADESSMAFHLANLLSSAAMTSTQLQSIFLESLAEKSFQHSLRQDIIAVSTRDPAVKRYTDVLLYFKGFHALQTHRVAHWLWTNGRQTLALYLHSRSNAVFQIDIHPAAQIGYGVMIDHGTGVVIGETATIGHNVSMLHKVTLGGTGTQSVMRHPQIGNGVLLGAGATLLGPIHVGDGAHIGACSMILEDVPNYAVAVGVPARILSRKVPISNSYNPALTMETNNLLFFDI